MNKEYTPIDPATWTIKKIGVIGPGIVGMPMAAMLANARICIGSDQPAKVVVVQRESRNSGWKVNAINRGESVIGGIEPELGEIVQDAVAAGILSATHDFMELSDADVVLVSVQTDKKGFEPDYEPLFGALEKLAEALQKKPVGKIPLVIFESTLAPTTMDTLIRNHFAKYGLIEGKDILLGNSPNRVMPGRLVERIRESDKLAGGLSPVTPSLIATLYRNIITEGEIYQTNSLTAEIVKTLENAYRDVRIAFSAEVVRYCDQNNVDFYRLRDEVNKRLAQSDNASSNPNAVPRGGILIPMLGVGGHCLPKDGILLWWRSLERGLDSSGSLILQSRIINDESPAFTFMQADRVLGGIRQLRIALLGVAYRFNSEDTRNSPTLALANHLREQGISYIMHDPYVKNDDQNLRKFVQTSFFTNDLKEALKGAEIAFVCTAHKPYMDDFVHIASSGSLKCIMDACNIYQAVEVEKKGLSYAGIGRGTKSPDSEFTEFVFESFRVMEKGLSRELSKLIEFYNSEFAQGEFNKVAFSEVQRLAKSCSTGCEIADTGVIERVPVYKDFATRLARAAFAAQ
jgi:UDP-N-acetyl-D-mannosaminuronic acid dehydrogenase